MANKIDEGMTSFSADPGAGGQGSWFSPQGVFGKWFSRFSVSRKKPYISQQGMPGNTPLAPLAGDTIVNPDVVRGDSVVGEISRTPYLPQIEITRKRRYQEYEKMDDYPEISSAFDIFADDMTQKDTKNSRWIIESDSQVVIQEVDRLFKKIKLDRWYWDMCRNIVKYGDLFIEIVIDLDNPRRGIQRIKILNPNFLIRVENESAYLTAFLQEIPDVNDFSNFGANSNFMRSIQYMPLDKNQIVHFRIHNADPKFYPYGKGIAAAAIRTFRSLKLMEDAMLVYRLSRAPERRIFYINTGNMSTSKAEAFVERLKQKFKKEKFYNPSTDQIDERYNPMSFDEDFYVPHRGNKETEIDTLPGAENLGDIDDVKYFRDKLLALLKIPKDYIVEKDKSPERKANLSQLDTKFAKVIVRLQHEFEIGLETIARRHLQIRGFPASVVNSLNIRMPDPSDMFTKRKLDIDDQKARVVQAVKNLGLFSDEDIYEEYYEMTAYEIEETQRKMRKQIERDAELAELTQGAIPGEFGAGPLDMMPGGAAQEKMPEEGGDSAMGSSPEQQEKAQEATVTFLSKKLNKALVEGNRAQAKVFGRVLKKMKKV